MAANAKIIESISRCEDTDKLRTWIKNAKEKGADDVVDAAFRKLVSIVPSEQPGTAEHDFWQAILALEYVLSEERGKTTRLTRTRQKITRDGILKTMKDLALSSKPAAGFEMLLERGMPELTGEAIILRYPDKFDADTQAAAHKRLSEADVDVNAMLVSLAK